MDTSRLRRHMDFINARASFTPLTPAVMSLTKETESSRTTQESTVFNNPQDSDIVLEYNGKKFHAHRAILRMSSPFFERILQSQWPVAKGPVFSLGDDDNSEIVDAMLRHMYDLPYLQPNIKEESNLLKFHVDVYMLADKYDCPSLRNVAVINFRRTADRYLSSWGLRVTLDKCSLFKTIAEFCGPDAQQTADPSLRQEALKFCAFNYASFFTHKDFQKQVKDGTMFDADAMAELLMNVGALALEKDTPSRPTRSRDYSDYQPY